MIEEIRKTREYLDYLEEHYMNVQKAYAEFKDRLGRIPNEKYDPLRKFADKATAEFVLLEGEVEAHDRSKMSAQEFVQYRRRFFPTKDEAEFESKWIAEDFKDAWRHHLDCNKHHPQRRGGSAFERVIHVAHNALDWVAMSYKYDSEVDHWYLANKQTLDLPVDEAAVIELVFDLFKEK